MFIGRERELESLNQMERRGNFECVIIWGRRRVGKTALMVEFTRNKTNIFFTARETNAAENLALLSSAIQGHSVNSPVFQNYDDALDSIFTRSESSRLIFVIDEFPYLAKAWQGISSALQEKIDHRSPKCKLFIILCGSSMSFMEHQVLGYQSPLYGRRTAQYKIEAFDFFESRAFFPAMAPEEAACVYGITGGIPLYLSYFSDGKSTRKRTLKEKVIDNFLKPASFLFEEPSNLLKQELREPSNYSAILAKIAEGKTKLSEIASKSTLETATASHLIATLMELGIVQKESPATESPGRKPLYSICDNLFRFWFYFIPDIYDIIQHNNSEKAWEIVEQGLSTYMGKVFEAISIQYLWRENNAGRLPFFFRKAGRWWGNDPIHKKESEIDIVAFEGRRAALFCECKWKNEETGSAVLQGLKAKAEQFPFEDKYYILFSRSNFSSSCRREAEQDGHVRLVAFTEMCR